MAETDFLRQVGKTVRGQPISDQQFQLIGSDVCHHLDLKRTDVVLDLCCGNGLITKQISNKCKEVVGIDFYKPLLEVAIRHHRPENVSYRHMSVLDLSKMPMTPPGPFNKVLMYEALQHFKKGDLIRILRNVLWLAGAGCVILIGSIPDARRKWNFYNTPWRRFNYLLHKIIGGHVLGTWWDQDFIRATCKRLNLQCEFLEQSKELHTSHYRFDVRIVCP